MGTPHHGSGLAQWAELVAKSLGLLKQTNPDIVAVLKRDSEVLARIQEDFHAMIRSRTQDRLHPVEITCFFEQLPLVGIGTVSTLNLWKPQANVFRLSLLIQRSSQAIFRSVYELITWI